MRATDNAVPRTDTEAVAALREALRGQYSPSCLVADADPRVGVVGGLQVIDPGHRVVGRALTVDLPVDNLVDILPVLPLAEPGDVVVLACHGNTRMAMWGGLMTTLSQMAGIAGAVVDGAIRDVDELRDLDFPVWYRCPIPRRCPPAVPGSGEPVQVNTTIVVGDTVVEPGDVIVADENGVSIVPPATVESVLRATEQILAKESAIRDKMNAGATLEDLLAEFGHI